MPEGLKVGTIDNPCSPDSLTRQGPVGEHLTNPPSAHLQYGSCVSNPQHCHDKILPLPE